MDPREFPTKGNLIAAKNSLTLAKQGYDLMDKKEYPHSGAYEPERGGKGYPVGNQRYLYQCL